MCTTPPGMPARRRFWPPAAISPSSSPGRSFSPGPCLADLAQLNTSPPMEQNIKKVVLAYSGGLDTSVILRWLQNTYKCEVVTFTADLGQGEELTPARQKAEMFGIKEIFIE